MELNKYEIIVFPTELRVYKNMKNFCYKKLRRILTINKVSKNLLCRNIPTYSQFVNTRYRFSRCNCDSCFDTSRLFKIYILVPYTIIKKIQDTIKPDILLYEPSDIELGVWINLEYIDELTGGVSNVHTNIKPENNILEIDDINCIISFEAYVKYGNHYFNLIEINQSDSNEKYYKLEIIYGKEYISLRKDIDNGLKITQVTRKCSCDSKIQFEQSSTAATSNRLYIGFID